MLLIRTVPPPPRQPRQAELPRLLPAPQRPIIVPSSAPERRETKEGLATQAFPRHGERGVPDGSSLPALGFLLVSPSSMGNGRLSARRSKTTWTKVAGFHRLPVRGALGSPSLPRPRPGCLASRGFVLGEVTAHTPAPQPLPYPALPCPTLHCPSPCSCSCSCSRPIHPHQSTCQGFSLASNPTDMLEAPPTPRTAFSSRCSGEG